MRPTIVVTRHPGLVEYLREVGLIGPEAEVIAHATADQVRGRRVIGVLPLALAALAQDVTEIPLAMAPADRGVELTCARVRQLAGPAVTYRVVVSA